MMPEMNTTEGLTRFYSDTEVGELIEELSDAAEDAIEQAAAGAAKAATLASLEREAALLQARAAAVREASRLQAEVLRWQEECQDAKKAGVKTAVITGVICFFGGLVVGVSGVLILQGGR
jgi:ABC-type transporter Mla maintaining outer membrane lipid asymmetry permease subunit MlaE